MFRSDSPYFDQLMAEISNLAYGAGINEALCAYPQLAGFVNSHVAFFSKLIEFSATDIEAELMDVLSGNAPTHRQTNFTRDTMDLPRIDFSKPEVCLSDAAIKIPSIYTHQDGDEPEVEYPAFWKNLSNWFSNLTEDRITDSVKKLQPNSDGSVTETLVTWTLAKSSDSYTTNTLNISLDVSHRTPLGRQLMLWSTYAAYKLPNPDNGKQPSAPGKSELDVQAPAVDILDYVTNKTYNGVRTPYGKSKNLYLHDEFLKQLADTILTEGKYVFRGCKKTLLPKHSKESIKDLLEQIKSVGEEIHGIQYYTEDIHVELEPYRFTFRPTGDGFDSNYVKLSYSQVESHRSTHVKIDLDETNNAQLLDNLFRACHEALNFARQQLEEAKEKAAKREAEKAENARLAEETKGETIGDNVTSVTTGVIEGKKDE